MSWRKKPMNHNEIKTWYSMYAERRYGMDHSCSKEAWTILSTSVFNATGDNFHRLTLLMTSPHPTKRNVAWYSVHDLVKAWDSMINCINVDPKYMESSGFKFDIIDLTRQVIADLSPYWFYESNRCFLVHDMNDERFMFGKWIKDARRTGTSMNESNLFEFNARNQVTIWGPRGEISDYAAKQWGELNTQREIHKSSTTNERLYSNVPLAPSTNSNPIARFCGCSMFLLWDSRELCKSSKMPPLHAK
ncbi:NAGLU [Lepeophtheirus salmonis]|uniref:NAGLU n=1 Tax=Lepeophtheirus salmonis TaxID=72036 RepID=A0A7R8H612_LEPSM|nr:NAGLU [Lepeophtheirus salmonis]CAF2877525.1 NAGLU [Lepeophtheirus salmonis]